MKDLASASPQEITDFFNSFETILCDVDGVLWLPWEKFDGTQAAIAALKKINKKVIFASNNATKPIKYYVNELKEAGFAEKYEDLVVPTLAMIDYLESNDYDKSKEIFIIGNQYFRKEFESAGFKLAPVCPNEIEEVAEAFIRSVIVPNPNIGCVIIDMEANLNYIKLQRAALYLKNPKVLFLSGGGDDRLPFKGNITLIGPGCFHRIVEFASGRTRESFAKPHAKYNDYIRKRYNITDPSRVLFIGDSIPEDMGFAAKFGYKKLLVLTGLSHKSDLDEWKYPEENKPDFYVEGLRVLTELIAKSHL